MSKPVKKGISGLLGLFVLSLLFFTAFRFIDDDSLPIDRGERIFLIGGNLGSRMINFGHFETEMQVRYPDHQLFIRNMCDPGDTPGFRPRSARFSPWAFPGAEKFQTEYANPSDSQGNFPSDDQWLIRLGADVVVGFFGYSESFQGEAGLANFKAELDAFLKHSLSMRYNGITPPKMAIVSPIAYEDLSAIMDVPDGKEINKNLSLYTEGMKEVCEENKVLFVDAFTPSQGWYKDSKDPLTIDGSQMNDAGYQKLGVLLADKIFGKESAKSGTNREMVHKAVKEKNFMWLDDYKIPNGVHAWGRRFNPFGPDNYPYEIDKIRQMTAIRDTAVWAAACNCEGFAIDVAAADKRTRKLPPVKTNFNPEANGSLTYLYGQDALDKLKVPAGYKIELFASEKEFPDLANPVQMTFDNKGRLWVVTMPSYPHYKPGDSKPDDKIMIYEDTNNDGKADKETIFVRGLSVPVGFELTPGGVYVSQGTNLKLFTDTDGDDHADKETIIMSGFDDHDTHHEISAWTSDPSGAMYMGEGVFLHTNVETSYGTVRGTNGGFYRYAPQLHKLERVAQLPIPNPWGIAFDEWGQQIYAETSSPDVRWMLPGTVKPMYGESMDKGVQLIQPDQRVRPTSGLEFVSSRHFPDNVQGDFLINNTIGFLGMKMHTLKDDGTGYKSNFVMDLVKGDDRNFRPVDMEFAPDGSLYFIDWHNILIGHMQHNARDPLRDHVHGRIYRITYPSRPLVKPAKIAGASVEQLLDNLKLPEYRSRYRTQRELRGRKPAEVLPKITKWVAALNKKDPKYEHNVLEALWTTWGLDRVDKKLLDQMLHAKDYHARAAAVRVVRYVGHQIPNQAELLTEAARDPHGRVRLEAIVAASWLDKEKGLAILAEAKKMPLDSWMEKSFETAEAHLNGQLVRQKQEKKAVATMKTPELDAFAKGKEIFSRDGYCATCHQPDGLGLSASGFPPLAGTKWVNGNEERLIKIVLKGLLGPIEVNGKDYPGLVPMTPFGAMLDDQEIASVLTYVRKSFGNDASAISAEKVKEVRANTEKDPMFYKPNQLLKEYPMEK